MVQNGELSGAFTREGILGSEHQACDHPSLWDVFPQRGPGMLEPISKMSFGPISLLAPRFKSSTYNSMPAV
jgi:hypothetical protein